MSRGSRRARAVVALSVVAALLAGGCADSDTGEQLELGDGPAPGATKHPGQANGGGAVGPDQSIGGTGGSGGGDGGGGRAPGGQPGSDPPPAASLPDDGGPPGSFAPGYLRPAPAHRVVVELHSQDGAALRAESLEHLTSRLGQVTGKPVVVDGPVGFSDGRRQWSGDEVRGAAAALARVPQGEGNAVMRVLLLRGEFEAGNVLGAAAQGAVMAIFVDEVQRAGSPLTGPARIERAVMLHEAGHLLGLVDLYLDTGRDDPEHPGHSRNEDSVMYWAVESTLVGELLGGGPPTEFDDADRRDLAAIAAGA